MSQLWLHSTFDGSLSGHATYLSDDVIEKVAVSITDAGGSTYSPSGLCSGGTRTWDLYPRFTVANDSTTHDAVTISDTGYALDVAGRPRSTDVRVVDDGGFVSGITLGNGDQVTVSPHLQVALPCDPDPSSARLIPRVTTDTGLVFEGSEQILGSQSVPVGTIGIIGLVVLLGLAFGLLQLRSRRASRA